MKKLIYCFDLDNVLCKTPASNYKKSKPIKRNINILSTLKKRGHYIKIFTARYMGRNNENSKLAKKQGYKFTKDQLKNWGVHYDELIFGKPSYDIFVDDKNLSFKNNWSKYILKKIKKKI
jgi:hypothetical protein